MQAFFLIEAGPIFGKVVQSFIKVSFEKFHKRFFLRYIQCDQIGRFLKKIAQMISNFLG